MSTSGDQDTPWSEEERALLREATPDAPSGLAGRVLDAVREAALRKIRFRQELELSARVSLIAAAAGLLACAALVLGGGSPTPSVAFSPAGQPRASASVATPTSASEPSEASEELDDSQALTLSNPPGVLETELTLGLWLFAEEEGE
jgi:hypothetical protein